MNAALTTPDECSSTTQQFNTCKVKQSPGYSTPSRLTFTPSTEGTVLHNSNVPSVATSPKRMTSKRCKSKIRSYTRISSALPSSSPNQDLTSPYPLEHQHHLHCWRTRTWLCLHTHMCACMRVHGICMCICMCFLYVCLHVCRCGGFVFECTYVYGVCTCECMCACVCACAYWCKCMYGACVWHIY